MAEVNFPKGVQRPRWFFFVGEAARLSTGIAIAASGLAVTMILVLGAVSYFVIRTQVTDAIRSDLRSEAASFAQHVSDALGSITTTLSGLSRNTVLTNALMDSIARSTYLDPFLRDFRLINGVPVEIALTDFEGNPVAGSYRLSLKAFPWKDRVLEDGRVIATIIPEDDGESLHVAEPIFYARTKSPEGALVYKVSLRDLLKPADSGEEHAHSVRLLHIHHSEDFKRQYNHDIADNHDLGDGRDRVSDDIIARHSVFSMYDFTDFELVVEVAADREVLEGPLRHLLYAYGVVGLISVASVLFLGRAAGRHLAKPLSELESVATAVVSSGSLDHSVRAEGPLEIARLGSVFNTMLQRLAEANRELQHLALYDSLTGLANRNLFKERLEAAVEQALRTDRIVALLLLDLDFFKEINDIFGHPVGDALLQEVAARLRRHIRGSDTIARLGGDEFAIIATNLAGSGDAEILASKLHRSLARPFEVESHRLVVTCSIGIALFPADERNSHQLLRNADLALYQVKADERNGYHFYSEAMNERMLARRSLETMIRSSLHSGGFCLNFQPKIDIRTGEVVGAEALLRCRGLEGFGSEEGLVPPPELIAVAESTGLISDVGEWVLREACVQLRSWLDAGLPPLSVAVNLSAIQLRRSELVETILHALQDSALSSDSLELEITESAMMERVDWITENLVRLHDHGLRLAIDDFGTGYSSMAYLKRFPVDTLKIDRSFVDGVVTSEDDTAITRAIIALGQSLNLNVVAEGVETQSQLSFLKAHCCPQAQGYFFAPPMPGDVFAHWWRNQPTSGSGRKPKAAAIPSVA